VLNTSTRDCISCTERYGDKEVGLKDRDVGEMKDNEDQGEKSKYLVFASYVFKVSPHDLSVIVQLEGATWL
jgi:hypothetical protein